MNMVTVFTELSHIKNNLQDIITEIDMTMHDVYKTDGVQTTGKVKGSIMYIEEYLHRTDKDLIDWIKKVNWM